MTYHWVVPRVTRRVPHMGQELLTLSKILKEVTNQTPFVSETPEILRSIMAINESHNSPALLKWSWYHAMITYNKQFFLNLSYPIG